MSQEAFAKSFLKKFKMEHCNAVAKPMELIGVSLSKFEGGARVNANKYQSVVGNLRYLTCTRSDITYSASIIIKFMEILTAYIRRQLRECYDTFREQNHLDCFTQVRITIGWWITSIVTHY